MPTTHTVSFHTPCAVACSRGQRAEGRRAAACRRRTGCWAARGGCRGSSARRHMHSAPGSESAVLCACYTVMSTVYCVDRYMHTQYAPTKRGGARPSHNHGLPRLHSTAQHSTAANGRRRTAAGEESLDGQACCARLRDDACPAADGGCARLFLGRHLHRGRLAPGRQCPQHAQTATVAPLRCFAVAARRRRGPRRSVLPAWTTECAETVGGGERAGSKPNCVHSTCVGP